ncbi:hypothetical protein FQR65_LT08913 [Abscondita terminalis]|nr:hypothetical protein FQR65_LT08913 [Abscondita terminalis]
MDVKDVHETLQAANDYLKSLKKLQTDLNHAELQINKTTQESEDTICMVFDNIIASVTATLLNRRKELLNKNKAIKQDALLPLQECHTLILDKIKSTDQLIAEGQKLLNQGLNRPEVIKFNRKSSLLGSLPEVPSLKDVPYVSFQHDSGDETKIIDICKKLGSLIQIAPVQISTLLERPGAILIDWCVNVGEERFVEKYQLDRAVGDGNTDQVTNNFTTCYIGSDLQYLVKDLNKNQNYTFRVRCKFEGEEKWSLWSFPQIGKTNIKSFCWATDENFTLSNDNKIASPLNIDLMLYSEKIDFSVGYSVEITFLECDHNVNNNYVGLFICNKNREFILKDATICLETNGHIYGCGVKKAMQFAPIVKGSKICFTRDCKDNDKFRINMDCGNSRVTYDWL